MPTCKKTRHPAAQQRTGRRGGKQRRSRGRGKNTVKRGGLIQFSSAIRFLAFLLDLTWRHRP